MSRRWISGSFATECLSLKARPDHHAGSGIEDLGDDREPRRPSPKYHASRPHLSPQGPLPSFGPGAGWVPGLLRCSALTRTLRQVSPDTHWQLELEPKSPGRCPITSAGSLSLAGDYSG